MTGVRMPVSETPFNQLLLDSPDRPILIADTLADDRLSDETRSMLEKGGVRAMAFIPLTIAGRWVGAVSFSWPEPHDFTTQEEAICSSMISLVSPVIQSRRLFEQVQSRAQREQSLRQITAMVRNSTDPSTILRTAVREVGAALGRKAVIQLSTSGEEVKTKQDAPGNGKNKSKGARH
jgi:GAF domain-containing protein